MPSRVPKKKGSNTTAPEHHPQPLNKTGNANAVHDTTISGSTKARKGSARAPVPRTQGFPPKNAGVDEPAPLEDGEVLAGPPVPRRRGRLPNKNAGAEAAALLGGAMEALAGGDGVPLARMPAHQRFEGPDGDAAPTGDDRQAQVAKQKVRRPKKTGKKARDEEQAPAVGNEEAPAPLKVGSDEQPHPEQTAPAPLVPSIPAVGAVPPPPHAYPAPGRSTRKFVVPLRVDADDPCRLP